MVNNIAVGRLGEKLAASHLKNKGYRLIEQNFRCPLGEIDIIAFHNETLVFIEVKTRRSKSFGLPHESVTTAKQERIRKIALYYLNKKQLHQQNIRFDVVSILLKNREIDSLKVIANAF